ncbi:MAG: hypothetical protein CL840_19545 [Crocinitomicaceae bacterium]|nr:hypothetical protein [Crocinitomicaceae bacterium]|tara:strand:- start:3580 stop:4323 length:744 start_codon:yes stop_codon:yes gene_type:complete
MTVFRIFVVVLLIPSYFSSYSQQFTYPEPSGGYANFTNVAASHMQYPQHAYDNDKDGPVYISFLLDENGKIFKFIEWESSHSSLTNEARRMIDIVSWKPGTINGVKDTSQVNFVFIFQLHAGGYSFDQKYFEHPERKLYSPHSYYSWRWVTYKEHSEKVPSFSDEAFKTQYLKAVDLIKNKDFKSAYAELKQLYPRDPKNHEVLFQLAVCANELGKSKAACRYINKAIENGNPVAVNFKDSFCTSPD